MGAVGSGSSCLLVGKLGTFCQSDSSRSLHSFIVSARYGCTIRHQLQELIRLHWLNQVQIKTGLQSATALFWCAVASQCD